MKFIAIGLLCLLCARAWAEEPQEPAQSDQAVEPESDAGELQPVPIAGFTYQSGKYALSTVVKLNWFQAQAACAQQGYDLASAPTQNAQIILFNFLLTSGLSSLLTEPIWTAGSDLAYSTQWSWYNTGDPFNYQNFLDTPSTTHSCLAIDAATSYWSAEDCSSRRYFVCQKRCTR
ncbi:hypothetical protein KR222_002141 [Zaprionus bogoriensis]|nr:hypothetical protein KR222_002141 [Zaprionus bogoriensis]